MPHDDRVEIHTAPTSDSGGLRLVIDQHVVDGNPHHRVDLSYVVSGHAYRATLDGAVSEHMKDALRALLEVLLPACCQQMGFDEAPAPAPAPE